MLKGHALLKEIERCVFAGAQFTAEESHAVFLDNLKNSDGVIPIFKPKCFYLGYVQVMELYNLCRGMCIYPTKDVQENKIYGVPFK